MPMPKTTDDSISSSGIPTCRSIVTYLKVGTATLVLVHDRRGIFSQRNGVRRSGQSHSGDFARSRRLNKKVKLDDGRQMTAIEVQRVYLDRARRISGRHRTMIRSSMMSSESGISVLDRLEEDPMQLVREVDWVTKKHLIQSYIDKKIAGGTIRGCSCSIFNFMTSNGRAGCII